MNLSHNFRRPKIIRCYLAWKSIQCKLKCKEVFIIQAFFLSAGVDFFFFFFFARGVERLCGFLKADWLWEYKNCFLLHCVRFTWRDHLLLRSDACLVIHAHYFISHRFSPRFPEGLQEIAERLLRWYTLVYHTVWWSESTNRKGNESEKSRSVVSDSLRLHGL